MTEPNASHSDLAAIIEQLKEINESLSIAKRIEALCLRKDDIVIVTAHRRLPAVERALLAASVNPFIPDHKIIVLDEGTQIGVVRRDVKTGQQAKETYMDHEKIVNELEVWLNGQLKSYKSGELMSTSEVVWGGKAIEDVLVKLADLKATIKSQPPRRLVFTDDGTKALIVGEDGTVIHEYVFNESGVPIYENV